MIRKKTGKTFRYFICYIAAIFIIAASFALFGFLVLIYYKVNFDSDLIAIFLTLAMGWIIVESIFIYEIIKKLP